VVVFERYTEEARQVVVVAQEEARALRHGHIGTEHLLLALLGLPGDSVVGKVLAELGLTLDDARDRTRALVPEGESPASGMMPFTPRSKRALEISLREALGRGDPDIGPEHILLAVASGDEESVGVRVLHALSVTPEKLRAGVLAALPPPGPSRVEARRLGRHMTVPAGRIGVDLSADANRVLMSAAARALDDGRTLISVEDLEEALRRRRGAEDPPPQSATG
jgi:ATP-dependent Clp protease ATP-binding subunit ClpC